MNSTTCGTNLYGKAKHGIDGGESGSKLKLDEVNDGRKN